MSDRNPDTDQQNHDETNTDADADAEQTPSGQSQQNTGPADATPQDHDHSDPAMDAEQNHDRSVREEVEANRVDVNDEETRERQTLEDRQKSRDELDEGLQNALDQAEDAGTARRTTDAESEAPDFENDGETVELDDDGNVVGEGGQEQTHPDESPESNARDAPDDGRGDTADTDRDAEADAAGSDQTGSESESESENQSLDEDPQNATTGSELGMDHLNEQGDFGGAGASAADPTAGATDPEDADLAEAWGTRQTREFTVRGVRVKMSEPEDDDSYINTVRGMVDENASEDEQEAQMRKATVKLATDQPTITDELWETMTPTVQNTLATAAADVLGLNDFIGALGVGQNPQPGA